MQFGLWITRFRAPETQSKPLDTQFRSTKATTDPVWVVRQPHWISVTLCCCGESELLCLRRSLQRRVSHQRSSMRAQLSDAEIGNDKPPFGPDIISSSSSLQTFPKTPIIPWGIIWLWFIRRSLSEQLTKLNKTSCQHGTQTLVGMLLKGLLVYDKSY